jgi:hypothetical protein
VKRIRQIFDDNAGVFFVLLWVSVLGFFSHTDRTERVNKAEARAAEAEMRAVKSEAELLRCMRVCVKEKEGK